MCTLCINEDNIKKIDIGTIIKFEFLSGKVLYGEVCEAYNSITIKTGYERYWGGCYKSIKVFRKWFLRELQENYFETKKITIYNKGEKVIENKNQKQN